MRKNSIKKIRESLMMSKAELARRANISDKTITRIESGMFCRIDTKRKIILALGLKFSDKKKLFGEDVELSIKDKEDKRSGVDRRIFSYDGHIPENRSGKERRNGL
jgi:DNA-binding XRE family transcriptional regulator